MRATCRACGVDLLARADMLDPDPYVSSVVVQCDCPLAWMITISALVSPSVDDERGDQDG